MHDHKQKRISRRDILGALTAAGAAAVAGACGSSSPTSPTASGGTTTTTGGTTSGAWVVRNSQTEAPYPDRTGMINNAAFHHPDRTDEQAGPPPALHLPLVRVARRCPAH